MQAVCCAGVRQQRQLLLLLFLLLLLSCQAGKVRLKAATVVTHMMMLPLRAAGCERGVWC
jgi:hypothetical protein